MKAKAKPLKTFNFVLPDRSRAQLERLAEHRQCNKTKVILQLLERANAELDFSQQAEG